MNVLGLITARGQSKGIPGKNLAPCNGRPLIYWTCVAAKAATCLSRVLVSTDDDEIADYCVSLGVQAPFRRPGEYATDAARSISVARHAIDWLEVNEQWRTDVLVLLQPTSPLRVSRHIDEAHALLVEGIDAVVSIVPVPHRFAPWSVLRLDDGLLHPYQTAELSFDPTRRQGQPTLYARNGPAIVVSRVSVIRSGSFYGDRTAPYPMTARDSIDIDDPDDLAVADWQLSQREGKS